MATRMDIIVAIIEGDLHTARRLLDELIREQQPAPESRKDLVWHMEDGEWNLCHPGSESFWRAPYSCCSSGADYYASRGASHSRGKSGGDWRTIAAWAEEDGYRVPPFPGEGQP